VDQAVVAVADRVAAVAVGQVVAVADRAAAAGQAL